MHFQAHPDVSLCPLSHRLFVLTAIPPAIVLVIVPPSGTTIAGAAIGEASS